MTKLTFYLADQNKYAQFRMYYLCMQVRDNNMQPGVAFNNI